MIQGIKQLKMDEAAVQFIDDISKADALLALQSKLKKNPRIQAVAKSYGIPIYATKVIKIALALLVLKVIFFFVMVSPLVSLFLPVKLVGGNKKGSSGINE